MPTMSRRLQILLNEERFQRLERLAAQRHMPVAALVREAIDRAFPPQGLAADEAADRFLARAPLDLGSWPDAKAAIEESLVRPQR